MPLNGASDMSASEPAVKAVPSSYAFVPRQGETEWWIGDPGRLPLLRPGEPHPHIVMRPRTLSPQQCRVLIDCFERNRESRAAKDGPAYWAGRYIWQNVLPESEIDAIRIMQQVRFVAQALLTEAAGPLRPIYSDTAQLVRWHEGLELTPHTDNMEPDGRPNGTPHRSFSSLMYLNDDYEGGETYFPGHGVRLKPEAGALVVFGAGPEFVHGVTRVRRGLRYTYAGWFTYDKELEDGNAMRVF
jgi:hypothetical protein